MNLRLAGVGVCLGLGVLSAGVSIARASDEVEIFAVQGGDYLSVPGKDVSSGDPVVAPVRIERNASGEISRVERVSAAEVEEATDQPFSFYAVMTWAAGYDRALGGHGSVGFLIGLGRSVMSATCTGTGAGNPNSIFYLPGCGGTGVLVEVAAGQFGISAELGYGYGVGIGVGGERAGIMLLPAFSVAATLKVVHTWGNPELAGRSFLGDSTLVGPEASLTLPIPAPVKFTMGVLFRVGGPEIGARVILNYGVSVGF